MRALSSYDVNRDPSDLDYLVYQVNKLYRCIALSVCFTSEVLDQIDTSLSLLEELSVSNVPLTSCCYVPPLIGSGGRGRPRLDI